MRDMHNGIFAKTIKRQKLDVFTRQTQKNFVDNLIITHNKTMEKTSKKTLHEGHDHSNCRLHNHMPMLCNYALKSEEMFQDTNELDDKEARYANRNVFYATSNRVSDVVSVKRGELLRIRDLLSKRLNTYDEATKFHYQDLILRIEEALNIHQ